MNNMNNKKPKKLTVTGAVDVTGFLKRPKYGARTKYPAMDPNAKIQVIKLPKPKRKGIAAGVAGAAIGKSMPKRKITPANPTNSIPKPLPILSDSIEKGIKKGLNNYKR